MSDATIVAGQIQDVASSIDDVAAAIRLIPSPQVVVHVPEQPPPAINVEVAASAPPNITFDVPTAPPPNVNVEAPVVNFNPEITLQSQPPVGYTVRVTERDAQGLILSFNIKPIK